MTENEWLELARDKYVQLIDCSPPMALDLAHALLYNVYDGVWEGVDPEAAVLEDIEDWF